ncbi:FISUMP domain-containing protein [Flavobacterium sp. W22_SRS_FP1]|uniref:FISUMP domain-containing protein n=1 Tax=Flavobacterium sp. W22_SRS_FP1 TaxID=3240276 RepID=UPI003F92F8B7
MTVEIGTQVWMKKNINTTIFNNGDFIPNAQSRGEWYHSILNKSPAFYFSDEYEGEVLYNYYAITDSRGLLTEEFKIPNSDDINELIDYLGGKEFAGLKLKSIEESDFPEIVYLEEEERLRKNKYGNLSGFTAKAIGLRRKNGWVTSGFSACFWFIDKAVPSCLRLIEGVEVSIIECKSELIEYGFSVRALKK